MRKRQLSLKYTGDVFFKTFALLSERSWQSSLLNLLPVPGASSLGGYVFMKKTSSPPWTPGTDFGESVIAYEVIQTGVIKS